MYLKYKCLSLNVAGLLNLIKRKRVSTFLKKDKVGILYLQETHLRAGEEQCQLFKGEIHHAPYISRSRGGMIEIAETVPWNLKRTIIDKEGRFVILFHECRLKPLALVGIYAPHKQQVPFWKGVWSVNREGVSDILLLGDFNATFDNDID